MSTYKIREIKQALLSKGFQESNTHHHVYHLWVGNKKTGVRTYLSFGAKEYNDSLLGFVAKQLRLRRSELDDLIDCPISGEQYVNLLVERGDVRLS